MIAAPGRIALAGILAFLSSYCAAAELPGTAFSNPDYRAPVPADWVARPIRYDAWAGDADLAVGLDQHLYQALLPAVREFARQRGITIAVKEGTCGISAGLLMDKHVDMGGFCCPPGDDDRLPGLRFVTLGVGSIALLVNRNNPIKNISLADARGAFAGRVSRWSDLAAVGPTLPGFIHPVGRLHCKRRPGHWRLLLDREDLFTQRLTEVTTIRDMLATVAGDSNAIGYEVLWMVKHEGFEKQVKVLTINGVSPGDRERVAAGAYPLYRTFNVTVWEGRLANRNARDLADYLRRQVETLDHRYGLIPVTALRKAGWRFKDDELVGTP